MKINFNQIELSKIDNFKNGEKYIEANMYVDTDNRIMKGKLIKGASIGVHTHDVSSEIVFIISGVATFICEGKTEIVKPGEAHYCKKGESHTLINKYDEDLIFYAVVPNHN